MTKLSDMSPAERFAHGTRARYTSGCRCDQCRVANRDWARSRAKAIVFHGKNPLVSSERAYQHLLKLSAVGVGRRAVSDACDVAVTVISDIRRGEKKHIRLATEQKILAVTEDARADRTLVAAGPTWVKIRRLLREGFTKAELARRLGYKKPALQFRRNFVEARTVLKIDLFYRMIMAGDDE